MGIFDFLNNNKNIISSYKTDNISYSNDGIPKLDDLLSATPLEHSVFEESINNNQDNVDYLLEDYIVTPSPINSSFSFSEDEAMVLQLNALYNEYLKASSFNNYENKIQIGKQLLNIYNKIDKTALLSLRDFQFDEDIVINLPLSLTDLRILMDDIEWQIENGTSSLKIINNSLIKLSDAKEYTLHPNTNKTLERKNPDSFPRINFYSVGKQYNKYSRASDYVSIYLDTTHNNPELSYISRICLIRFKNFVPYEILDSKTGPYSLDEIADEIINFIGKSPLVGFNTELDLKHLYANGLYIPSVKGYYSEKELIDDHRDKIKLSEINFQNATDYYVFDYNQNDARECCYVIGRLFERIIDSITNKIDRYME